MEEIFDNMKKELEDFSKQANEYIENLIKRNKELEKYYQNERNLLDSYMPKSKIEEYKNELEKGYKEELDKNSIKAFILKCKIEGLQELIGVKK